MNELIFTESQSMREDYISKDYVLDNVKGLVFLPDNINVTTEMVANYYEVPEGTIKSLIFDHKDEVESDGLKVLSGEELSSFKKLCQISSRAKALVIIPRRAILRIGMLLRDSEVAKKVRTYLLNIEENTDTYSRIVALVSDSSNKVNIIDNRLLRMENIVDTLESVSEEQRHIINLVLY
jgi:hypothetical protein